jgi:biopolymer transport protein TolR
MAMMVKNGGGRAGRRGRGGGTRHAPMSEINVTPMVDVMLVLLIIFMVSAPLLTAGVPLDLPSAKGKPLHAPKSEPVVVSVAADGRVFLGEERDEPISLEALGPKLKAVVKSRGGLEEAIFVRGDKSVPYGTIARVMANIKEAGFRKLSLVTEVESGG